MSQSFADIYSKWEATHDETSRIAGKIKKEEQAEEKKNELTLAQARKINVQSELDLHNVKFEDAVLQTRSFIESCWHKGYRKVRIVTGKGLHSPGGKSIIRPAVIEEVYRSKHISEVDLNPKPVDGGSGAIIILLKQ